MGESTGPADLDDRSELITHEVSPNLSKNNDVDTLTIVSTTEHFDG